MAGVKLQLQGYPAAIADAQIKLIHEASGATIERKPFLDGSLELADVEPGMYEMVVTHPNRVLPIDRRRIRVFPQPAPTYVPVVIDPSMFTDSPIRDVPDADLSPVQQSTQSIRGRLGKVGSKSSGDAIRSEDWNTLVSAVVDLASAVQDLIQRVAPKGHDHPEIADKIDEVENNLRKFAEAFGKSTVEAQREIEIDKLNTQIEIALEQPNVSEELKKQARERVKKIEPLLQAPTKLFTKELSKAGSDILLLVQKAADAQGANASAFLQHEEVVKLSEVSQTYLEAGTKDRHEAELGTYQRARGVRQAAKKRV